MRSIVGRRGRWQIGLRGFVTAIVTGLLLAGHARPAGAQSVPLVVRNLSFSGNHAFTGDSLSTYLRTTNSAFFARLPILRGFLGQRRTLDEHDFRGDLTRLATFYKASGYMRVKVDTVVRRTATDVWITFKVTEGEPVHVEKLDVVGLDSVDNAAQVRLDLPLETGDVFSRFRMRADSDTIATRLANRGFPKATVAMMFAVDSEQLAAQVTLKVNRGPYALFGPVRVEGQQAVDSGFIASLVPAHPGNPYRRDDVYRSQRALYASDLFRFASVQVDSSYFTDGDSIVPLVVRVNEGRMHRARASVGIGTDDCVRTGVGWTARNFTGGGKILDLSARLSKIGVGSPLGFGAERSICSQLQQDSVGSRLANYGLNASLRRNAFLSADNTLEGSLFAARRSEFMVYLREEVGAGLAFTHEGSSRIPITLAYRVSYGSTQANSASFCAFFNTCVATDIAHLRQKRILTTLSLTASRSRLNNYLDPTRGTSLAFEATVSSQLLGSSSLSQFTRFVGDAAIFFPLTRTIVVAGHVRGGVIFSPRIGLASGQANFVPPEQRFYAGGPNDVRGYNRNELGPVLYVISSDSVVHGGGGPAYPVSAVRVSATGGTRIGIANLELRVPSPILPSRMRLAGFVDAGTLWEASESPSLRITPGVGIRISSPLGPVRFDLGYNRYPLEAGPLYEVTRIGNLNLLSEGFVKSRASRWTWSFSVGQAF